MILPLLIFLSLLVSSCTAGHGIDRDALRATFHPTLESAAEEAGEAPSLRTWMPPMPFRLALYFVHNEFPSQATVRKAEWMSTDVNLLGDWFDPLREDQILSDRVVLVDPTIRDHEVGTIRQAAARYGVDAVLVLEGVGAVDRYQNKYAALYATLIGAYLAPGTHSDALFLIKATWLDVQSGQRYEPHLVEGHADTVGPALLVDDRQVLARAKKAALDTLGFQMTAQLRHLKASGRAAHEPLRGVEGP